MLQKKSELQQNKNIFIDNLKFKLYISMQIKFKIKCQFLYRYEKPIVIIHFPVNSDTDIKSSYNFFSFYTTKPLFHCGILLFLILNMFINE